MKLYVEWSRPIQLKDASKENVIYGIDLSKVNAGTGVYIFGRRWGSQFESLYVGKARNVRSRVKGHLNNLRWYCQVAGECPNLEPNMLSREQLTNRNSLGVGRGSFAQVDNTAHYWFALTTPTPL